MNYMSCLSRWRILIRKALSPVEKTAPATATAEPVSEQDEDEKLLNEMEELTNAMDRKKKRAKKVLAKKRAKVCSSSLICVLLCRDASGLRTMFCHNSVDIS